MHFIHSLQKVARSESMRDFDPAHMPSTRKWYHMECDYFKVRYMEVLNWEDMLVKDYSLPDSHPLIAAKYGKEAIVGMYFPSLPFHLCLFLLQI
jgi:hypothetical protein